MYKNPIPVLPEDEKYKKFSINFSYKKAMTVQEAAREFFAFLLDKGEIPTQFIKSNGERIDEYMN